jgi:2-succinyl-5-enolpyruvyl-6-hydroxy-3-cyclohexene-1-carboxylate synthase
MNDRSPATLNRLKATRLVEELHRLGVRHVVLCPGARNTPLLKSFTEHPAFSPQLVVDERGAAFMALGLLRAEAAHGSIRAPACVVTTSGTAALNVIPALAEAASEGLPLLLLTADRGPSEQLLGANQSLPQKDALQALCRGSYEIPAGEWEELVLVRTSQALSACLSPWPGPVHLNLPFEGSLLPDGRLPDGLLPDCRESDDVEPFASSNTDPFLLEVPVEAALSTEQSAFLQAQLKKAKRPLLIVAGLSAGVEREAAFSLMSQLGCPAIVDAGSSFRLGQHLDTFLLHHEFMDFESNPPDLILQLGKRPVSKHVPTQLSALKIPRIVVDPHPESQDPLLDGGLRYRISVQRLLESLKGLSLGVDLDWVESLQEADREIGDGLQGALTNPVQHPELRAIDQLLKELPNQWGLFTGNSLAIRHLDVLSFHRSTPVIQGTQRGCSGIDGLLATALGFAKEHHDQTSLPSLAMIGDLSLLHDLSSFHIWAENSIPLLVFCINNHGGGIFHQLPQRHHRAVLSPWCDAAHGGSLSALARSMDIPTWEADDSSSLQVACEAAFREGRGLLELSVPAGAHAEGWLSLVETLRVSRV